MIFRNSDELDDNPRRRHQQVEDHHPECLAKQAFGLDIK